MRVKGEKNRDSQKLKWIKWNSQRLKQKKWNLGKIKTLALTSSIKGRITPTKTVWDGNKSGSELV